jgi:hypothetical protein
MRGENISAPAKADSEHEEFINLLDGVGVHRYLVPHLARYQTISPVTLAGPAVPTSPPSVVYCPCCSNEEFKWDKPLMVDDVLAEPKCLELLYGIGEDISP